MKYISFIVPCYNSAEYMDKCIKSLLIGKEDVEIIIIDDGSTDKTPLIADKYKEKYPRIVKVVHQKNGGHGAGINAGLKRAKGKYIKIVDSDDWVDKKSLKTIIKTVKKEDADLIITNYVYTYNDKKDKVISFKNVFKDNETISWNDINNFKINQYLSIHSMMYKKDILDKANIKLPRHTFYEDNLYIYWALPYVNTIHYVDTDFYRYFIGRADQSVNINQLTKRSMHQVYVTEEAVSKHNLDNIKNKKLRKTMKRELVFLCTIGVVFSRLSKTDEGEIQYQDMWKKIKEINPKLYKEIRYNTLATCVSFKGSFGRNIAITGFKLAHKLVKFY